MKRKLSKRQFIKGTLLGTCTFGCGLSEIESLASSLFPGIDLIKSGDLPNNNDKFSVEALYYVNTPKGLKCLLCPNECKVKEGESSECRTRINNGGTLECIAYGNPCAVHIDPVEKKPLYHFLPASKALSIATAGCNLACLNCQNWEISQTSPDKTRNYDLMPEKVVEKCIDSRCRSIAYTYSDPVGFYEYVMDTAKIARQQNIKNIIVSAGYIYEKPLRAWSKYIDAANIDLKSFSNEVYEMLNAGKLGPVLDTLKTLKEEGVWLEITNLIIPEWTDDLDMIKRMCDWLMKNNFEDTPLHFSRFFPQYKLTELPPTPINTLAKARDIALSSGINYVYIGNAPEFGKSVTVCPNCKDEIIERIGFSIQTNNLNDGCCGNCGMQIPGVW
jgi:pyruvate formate lyase activating enzyme